MKIISEPHAIENFAVGVFNGAGNILYFETEEEARELVETYEEFRKANSLPWLTVKPAVNGRHILESFKLGLSPWKVILNPEGSIINIRVIPLHHITMSTICERYSDGRIRALEIWAPDDLHARFYALDVIDVEWKERLGNPEDDVQFIVEKEKEVEKSPAGASAPVEFFPGFGQAAQLSKEDM